jgi:peroxiredoxin
MAAIALGAIVSGWLVLDDERRPAPLVSFQTIKGEAVDLATLRGRVVLVNFWATDCVPCMKEMPRMVETHKRFRAQGLEAVFVAMQHDRPDFVIGYADKHGLPFRVALDLEGKVARAFGNVRVTPTAFVIDRRGVIAARIVGEPDFGRLHSLIEAKLREPA